MRHLHQINNEESATGLYQPLPAGATTRRLEIQPGEGELQLGLLILYLDNPPAYDALSYTWGDRTHNEIVRVNGFFISVTRNLYDALLSIRRGEDTPRVWVDALCINQADITERSAQIPQLLRIYQTARRVLVWLQNEDESTALALQHAQKLIDRQQVAVRNVSEKIDLIKVGETALRNLFGQSWFRRIWVIQEVSVSRKVSICLGATRVSWDLLRTAARHLERTQKTTYHALFDDVDDYKAGNRAGMLHMAVRHQDFEASDPRDKLYALLGLVAERERGIIAADYSKDVQLVYREFAITCLNTYGNLDVLASASQKRMAGLPSWVSDWSRPRPSYALSLGSSFCSWMPTFNASHGAALTYKLSRDGLALHVRGHRFGVIHRCTSSPTETDFHLPFTLGLTPHADWLTQRTKRILFYLECENLVGLRRQNHKYPTGESVRDAYWQVLCGGCNSRNRDEIYAEFVEWDKAMNVFSWLHTLHLFDNRKLIFVLMTGWLMRRTILHKIPSLSMSGIPASEQPWSFLNRQLHMQDRVMVRTGEGYFGFAPSTAQRGDEVWLVQGGSVPVILRPKSDSTAYEVLGEAYIHGVMQGEAFDLERCTTVCIE